MIDVLALGYFFFVVTDKNKTKIIQNKKRKKKSTLFMRIKKNITVDRRLSSRKPIRNEGERNVADKSLLFIEDDLHRLESQSTALLRN